MGQPDYQSPVEPVDTAEDGAEKTVLDAPAEDVVLDPAEDVGAVDTTVSDEVEHTQHQTAGLDVLGAGGALPLRPTFKDSQGVERIAGPSLGDWKPAPAAASEEEIAHAAEVNRALAAQRDERLAALGLGGTSNEATDQPAADAEATTA